MTALSALLHVLPDVAGTQVVLDRGAPDLEAALHAAGAARVEVSDGERVTSAADLVLLIGDQSARHVQWAAELLRPGGSVLLAAPNRLRHRGRDHLTPGGGRRLLQECGLRLHTTYGVHPGLTDPGFLVPVDPVDGAAHFASNVDLPYSSRAAAASWVLRRVRWVRPALFHDWAFRATRPGPAPEGWLHDVLTAARDTLHLNTTEPLRAVQLAVTSGSRLALLICGESGAPVGVVKVALDETRRKSLLAEHEVLLRLDSLDRIRDKAPVPVGLLEIRQRLVLVETVLPGRPLATVVHHRVIPTGAGRAWRDLRGPLAWLADLHRDTAGPGRVIDAEQIDRVLTALPPATHPEIWQRVRTRAIRTAEAHHGAGVPGVLAHGDLWPGNILVDAHGTVRVVDWESSASGASPLSDVVFLVSTYLQTRERRSGRYRPLTDTLLEAMTGNTWRHGLMERAVTEHLQALNLPVDLAPTLVALAYAEIAPMNDEESRWKR